MNQSYLNAHKVGTQGKDVIWQPLRDAIIYPSAGQASFRFFATPIGDGTSAALGAGASVSKTEYDTNIDLSGILGEGNEFYQIGLEFLFLPGIGPSSTTPGLLPGQGTVATANIGAFVNDVYTVGAAGLVTEKIGTNREYIQDGPLNVFPSATRLAVNAAVAAIAPTTQATQESYQINYACWSGEPYTIVPIYLGSTQKFSLAVGFAAAVPTPSGVPAVLIARARGYTIRQVT